MSVTGLIIGLVLTLITVVVLVYPLLTQQFALGESARRQLTRDELLTSYERVVTSIRDLDEDFRTGKMNAEDYHPEREQWAAQGVALLQQLEALGALPEAAQVGTVAQATPAKAPDAALDSMIEEAVARYVEVLKQPPSDQGELPAGTAQGVQR